MSKRRRATKIEEPVESLQTTDLITFSQFFRLSVINGEVKPWQEREILVFFKEIGLSEKEPKDLYEIALTKF